MVPVVQAKSLEKIYRRRGGEDVRALRGLELTVGEPGVVHGFLGPNGSGKTTAIRCLLGLIRPTGGHVRIFGVDSTTGFNEVAHRVGAIVESPKMFPNFSGRKNLALLARMYKLPGREVDRVLEIVRLDGRDGDTFGSYSLGMRQRLAIAGALLKDPELLILDEPANGLDPAGIAEMRDLIRTVAAQGTTILVSSHQLSEIEQVCTEATIIFNGKVAESGSLDEIRARHGATEVVVGIDQPDRAVQVLAAAGIASSIRNSKVVVNVGANHAATVNQVLADNSLFLSELRVQSSTLEDAFFKLTGQPISGQPISGPPPESLPPPAAADQIEARS